MDASGILPGVAFANALNRGYAPTPRLVACLHPAKQRDSQKTNMQNAEQLPVPRAGLIQAMAGRYNIDPAKFMSTLKATIVAKAANEEEVAAFCMVAHEYGLNPFLKEIHAFPNKQGGITPVVSVDGWASLMNRRPEFDGIEFEARDEDGKPHSVTARIYIKGRSRPVSVTEYYSECQRGTEPWKTMPRRMLRHKALIQCARVAFGFSGIHDEDEARDIIDVTPKAVTPPTATAFRKAKPVTPEPTPEVAPEPAPEPQVQTPQDELAGILAAAGFTLDDLNKWAVSEGEASAEFASFHDITNALATKLARAKVGLLAALKAQKGVAA